MLIQDLKHQKLTKFLLALAPTVLVATPFILLIGLVWFNGGCLKILTTPYDGPSITKCPLN